MVSATSLLLLLGTSAVSTLVGAQVSPANADLHERSGPSDFLQQQGLARRNNGASFSKDTSSCKGYEVKSTSETGSGLQVKLELIGEGCQAFGYDYQNLCVDVEYQTQERLRVHIYDAGHVEYQVPESVFPQPNCEDGHQSSSDLVFNHENSPFAFYITRRSDPNAAPIFDTRSENIDPVEDQIEPPYGGVEKNSSTATDNGKLVFEAGYLQIGSALPIGANIYGLGEVVAKSGFRRDENATVQTMWARDAGDPEDQNIYGSHPYYLETRHDANGKSSSHGVFLLSSQGMDILLRPGTIQYRTIGGSLDFFFTSGPTPLDVIREHYDVVGKPELYPAWSFGFHLCRWGYDNITQTREAVTRMREANIPLEVIWNDIDFMDTYRNWIPAPGRFDAADYTAFIDELHAADQHYIMIIDAAVSIETNSTDVYEPYTAGLAADAFMKNEDGSTYIGKVWPGYTAFPDFFNKGTQAWWTEAFLNFTKIVPFDGVWLDMNEPSSFCDGSCGSPAGVDLNNITTPFLLPGVEGNNVIIDGDYPEGYNHTLWGNSGNITINGSLTYGSKPPQMSKRDFVHYLEKRVGKGVNVDEPAYEIHNALGRLSMSTTSPNSTHADGSITHLDVHNLWGLMEEQATYNMFREYRPNERPFLISRSTFPGSGKVTGHWLGDNYSQWKYMRYAISHALQFQLFGVPLVGPDVCGFNGNTDEELCNRWMQLGAFFPFMRNHNTRSALSQEPFRWDSVAEASRTSLAIRYALLPHWYTLLANTTESGIPPMQALFFQFPDSPSLYNNSDQFLVGTSLLVTPVLEPNVTTVTGTLPGGDSTLWRDFYTHEVLPSGSYTFDAPLGHIPLSVRGGSIHLLHKEPGYTIKETRESPYELLVALDKDGNAHGSGYFDDGLSMPVTSSKKVWFGAQKGKVWGYASEGSYTINERLVSLTILGISSSPSTVSLSGANLPATQYTYKAETEELVVTGFEGDLNGGWEVCWD